MKLAIYNFSPKREKSNTAVLLNYFIKGYVENKENTYNLYYPYDESHREEFLKNIVANENNLIAFPLYFCSMPGIVKRFIEYLDELDVPPVKPSIGFLIQYGFLERYHAEPLENYLRKITKRLKFNYLGSIILPGSEGVGKETCHFAKSNLCTTYQIGRKFGKIGKFDDRLLRNICMLYQNPLFFNLIIKRFVAWYVNKFYWNELLKKEGTLKDSFQQPYYT